MFLAMPLLQSTCFFIDQSSQNKSMVWNQSWQEKTLLEMIDIIHISGLYLLF